MPRTLTLSHTLVQVPKKPQRNPLHRYTPTRVNEHTRWRLIRNRRREMMGRIGGEPNERQALAIEMLAKAEWALFVLERDDGIVDTTSRSYTLRAISEARKQVLMWSRELTAATKPPSAEPRSRKSLQDLFPGRNIPS